MKSFTHWGVKRRYMPDYNYNSLWFNLKTVRVGSGVAKELPPDKSEFYDVSLGTKCNACCDFCYVSASNTGVFYEDICETWKKWMSRYSESKDDLGITATDKPLQIAVGSQGEPTMHPMFCEFLETVYNTNVVPNYTTNGIILSAWDKPEHKDYKLANKILHYTAKYCGGVAVSFGNQAIREHAKEAIRGLIKKGDVNINIHHIISTKESVDEFVESWKEYGKSIAYHVLLPLMPSGRSKVGMAPEVFTYLENKIEELEMKNVAFGAHFIKYLEDSKIKTWLYPAESMSKNVLLKKDRVEITPSSFDMKPINIIEL